MKQLSLRGFDPLLEKQIRAIARSRGISLNKAALFLMRKGAGFDNPQVKTNVVGHSLDHLIGKWPEEAEEDFLRSIQAFERIDQDLWS